MKHLVASLLMRLGLGQLGVFVGYLRRSGWWRSLRSGRPEDAQGQPLPWYTYPMIHLLDERLGALARPFAVFEFGSGNSTLWWARRAAQVVSVEDCRAWFDRVTPQLPANVCYLFAADEAAYLDAYRSRPERFDLVVVDGSHRPRCLEASVERLADHGVLIVDNADWPAVNEAIQRMAGQGFRRLDLHGLGPVNGHPWATAIIYGPGNLLGL